MTSVTRGPEFVSHGLKTCDPYQEEELISFSNSGADRVEIPGTVKTVNYNTSKHIGIGISRLGTSKAIALGAYAFALSSLDTQ